MLGKHTLTMIISVLLAFGIGMGIGIHLGESLVPSPEVVKKGVLEEIDQKFLEKARNGFLPLFTVEIHPKNVSSFSGEIIEIDPRTNLLKVRVPNVYRGGSITEFLYQPNYFVKEVLVDDSTKIVRVEVRINQSFESPFEEIPISFSDLKTGQKVTFETRTPIALEEDKPVVAEVIRVE